MIRFVNAPGAGFSTAGQADATMLAKGLRAPLRPPPPPTPVPDLEASELTRSPFVNILPTAKPLSASATQIAVPAGSVFGQAAWFALINLEPRDTFGTDVALFSIEFSALSTNNADAAPVAIGSAWGDSTGMQAAIVVGNNLPIGAVGTWVDASCSIPSVGAGITLSTNDANRYWWYSTFPPGSLNDAIPFKQTKYVTTSPYVHRTVYGRPLQVALVVEAAAAQAAAASTIDGWLSIQLGIGPTAIQSHYTA